MDNDGRLSHIEFLIASHLLTTALKGEEIPDHVPTELLESSIQYAKKLPKDYLNVQPNTTNKGTKSGESQLDLSIFKEKDIQILTDKLNEEIIISDTILPSFGIEPLIDAYDASRDIERVDYQVTNLDIARAVIDQSDPEIKALLIHLDKETNLMENLNDKIHIEEKQEKIFELQKEQKLTQYKELSQKCHEAEMAMNQIDEDTNSVLQEIENLQKHLGNVSNVEMQANQEMMRQNALALNLKETFDQQTYEIQKLISELQRLSSESNLPMPNIPPPLKLQEFDF
jgi:hypothetical protein